MQSSHPVFPSCNQRRCGSTSQEFCRKRTSLLLLNWCHIFALLCFLLVILLFQMCVPSHEHSAGMLPIISRHKMTVVCLMDKIRVRLTSFSHESHSAVYRKLSVIEVTSLNRDTHHKYIQRHKTRFVMISSQKC